MKFIANHDYQPLGRPEQYVSYSNDAYGLLGSIIELVSGKSYEDYLQENILMPLGMAHTTTRVDRIKELPDVTSLYYKDKDDNLCTSEHWQEVLLRLLLVVLSSPPYGSLVLLELISQQRHCRGQLYCLTLLDFQDGYAILPL